nr:hypothetical protein [Candidatus Sigynarchaeota archaeon]
MSWCHELGKFSGEDDLIPDKNDWHDAATQVVCYTVIFESIARYDHAIQDAGCIREQTFVGNVNPTTTLPCTSLSNYLDTLQHVAIRPGAVKPGDPNANEDEVPDLSWLLR